MKIIVQNLEEKEILPCDRCGCYPVFIQPQIEYTDIWLECPVCGRQTRNTGGFHYAMEISLKDAKRDAVNDWNNKKFTA